MQQYISLVTALHRIGRHVQFYSRKHRLSGFGTARPQTADIVLGHAGACRECSGLAYAAGRELRRCGRDAIAPSFRNRWRPTAAMIDLRAFTSAGDFLAQNAKASGGNDSRLIKKARRLGLETSRIDLYAYSKSVAEIKESKTIRSQGLVLDALFKRSAGMTDTCIPPDPPKCDTCWRIDWGVFQKTPEGERLVAYGRIRRSGNYIELEHLMGHANALKLGAVKMLFADIMAWLLDPENELARGAHYIRYGMIENGSPATAQWRRYMQYRPYLVRLHALTDSPIPNDFRAKRYLSLNPDVRLAGMDPRLHFAIYGMNEAWRRYK